MQHLSPAIRVDEDERVIFYYKNTPQEVFTYLSDLLSNAGFERVGGENAGKFRKDVNVLYKISTHTVGTELELGIKQQETGFDDVTRLFVSSPEKKTEPELIRETDYNGSPRRYELFSATTFDGLSNVTQVYGVAVNKEDAMLVVGTTPDHWSLPGGGTEKGESLIDTLNREMYEEGAISVEQNSIEPLFYQYSYVEDTKNPGDLMFFATQVRFICRLDKADTFKNDPGGETQFQQWVEVTELEKYLPWGSQVEYIKKLVLEYLSQGK